MRFAINKREWTLLGKVFDAEIEAALHPNPLGVFMLQSKALGYEALAERGFIERVSVQSKDRLGTMTITGWALTTRGQFHYCEACQWYAPSTTREQGEATP